MHMPILVHISHLILLLFGVYQIIYLADIPDGGHLGNGGHIVCRGRLRAFRKQDVLENVCANFGASIRK